MSLYTLRNLVNDCSTRLTRTKCAVDKKKDTLEEIWRAFNDWIESRFEHGKGVHIATFGSIGWESCTNSRNQPKLRPVFVLSNTYIKTFGLLQRKPGVNLSSTGVNPSLSSLEEINFTKIAIKFSRNLTKDLVFAGLRDMLQRIGEVASTGAPMSITFHFGKLIAKNRYVTMLFDPLKFPRALEEEIARSMVSSPGSVLGNLADFDIFGEDEESGFSMECSSTEKQPRSEEEKYQHQSQRTRTQAPVHHGSKTSREIPIIIPTMIPTTTTTTTTMTPTARMASEQEQQEAELIRENLPTNRCDPNNLMQNEMDQLEMSLEEELKLFDDQISPSRQNVVIEGAFKRHIAALAEQVDREAKYAFDLQLQQKRDLETVALEKQMRRQCAEDLQRHLKSQMEAKAQQLLLQKQQESGRNPFDMMAGSCSSSSPHAVNESSMSMSSPDPTAVQSSMMASIKQELIHQKEKQLQARNQLKLQLEEQINCKVQERLHEKHKQLNEDKLFLRRLRNEMNAIEAKEAAEKEERKKHLTQAWQRDAMMRKLVEQKKKQRAAEQIHRQGIATEPIKPDYYPRLPQPLTPPDMGKRPKSNASNCASLIGDTNSHGKPKVNPPPAKCPCSGFLPSPQQQRRFVRNVAGDAPLRGGGDDDVNGNGNDDDDDADDYSVGFDIRSVRGG